MWIYIITNAYLLVKSGECKRYVGKDTGGNPLRTGGRAYKHLHWGDPGCPAIHKAIKTYGKDSFSVCTFHYPNISEKDLAALESWYMKYYNSHCPNGYNLVDQPNHFMSEATREKISTANTGNYKTRVWDPYIQSRVVELYTQRWWAVSDIADTFGVHKGTIYKVLHANNVDRQQALSAQRSKNMTSRVWDYASNIVDMYVNKGMSCREIGTAYHTSKSTIRAILHAQGVVLRDLKGENNPRYRDDLWGRQAEIIDLRENQGKTLQEIALIFNTNRHQISKIVNASKKHD